jgi:hypothetical protein
LQEKLLKAETELHKAATQQMEFERRILSLEHEHEQTEASLRYALVVIYSTCGANDDALRKQNEALNTRIMNLESSLLKAQQCVDDKRQACLEVSLWR